MKVRTAENKNGIIIGMILGDASISKVGQLRMAHSIKQEEYLLYKAEILKKMGFNVKIYYYETKLNNNKIYKQIYLQTNQPLYLKIMRKIFYKPNKQINFRQLKKLSPLGLAIWWMDDGSLIFQRDKEKQIESRKGILATNGFSKEENEIIIKYFKEVYDINCKLARDGETFCIYFNSTELKKLFNIINPYIINSMKYKLCMRYGKRKFNENLCNNLCSSSCKYNII